MEKEITITVSDKKEMAIVNDLIWGNEYIYVEGEKYRIHKTNQDPENHSIKMILRGVE